MDTFAEAIVMDIAKNAIPSKKDSQCLSQVNNPIICFFKRLPLSMFYYLEMDKMEKCIEFL